MSQLVNIHMNEETRFYQPLTNPDIFNSIDLTQDSCCFGNQDSHTTFLEHPLEETLYLEKSIEILRRPHYNFKNFLPSLSIGWKHMLFWNEETLSYQPLTNSDISNSINMTQDSCYFGNQDSISAHPFQVDQHQILENHIDMLASYPFS